MAKQHLSFFVRRLVGVALLGATPATLAPGAARAGEPGFTLACARSDLRAIAVIEERGRTAGTPTTWLANAGLNHLQARTFCLEGESDKGVALYQRIIDGDMSLSAPGTTK
jgi:hypothetical protein